MPACSMGFCVASTRNGTPTCRVIPSIVTLPSSMTSRSADWVFGLARLISSASTMFAKIGPGVELERPLLLVVHADAGDVAREQVGGELDAGVGSLHRLRHGARERGLAGSGHILEQHVAVAEHRRQHELDDVALAEHRPLDVVGDLPERLREPGRLLLRDGHGCCSSVVTDVGAGRERLRGGHGCGSPGAGGIGEVRIAVRREGGGRRGEAPSLRAPVDGHRDALDADRADRHRPGARRQREARRPSSSRNRSRALPNVICAEPPADLDESTAAGPGPSRPRSSAPTSAPAPDTARCRPAV